MTNKKMKQRGLSPSVIAHLEHKDYYECCNCGGFYTEGEILDGLDEEESFTHDDAYSLCLDCARKLNEYVERK